ncbi:hypothetical protein FKP32DRAFT_1681704 [Trametes sanguinea]|nr:hypothetical protein FKP32DRAFT_1681704 [Trametes sanguinea]
MPTVPSTCVSRDAFDRVPVLSDASILSPDHHTGGPTPDPDTDDVVLVPVEQGNAVSHDPLDHVPPAPSMKPRIDLGSLNLHSPSSIVGTPFDISPRFEYPFPPATCSPPFPSVYEFDPVMPFFPALASAMSMPCVPPPVSIPFAVSPIAASLPGRTRVETRGFSPTHPRLQPRDPPVPPSLVRKRRLHQPAVIEPVAPPEATLSRPRAGSLDSLPEHFLPVSHEQERGRVNAPLLDRFQCENERSLSLDARRKRSPLERNPSDVTVVDQDGGKLSVKPPLFHASPSSTLLPDTDTEDGVVKDLPRSASPLSAASLDERPDVTPTFSAPPSPSPSHTLPSSESCESAS